MKKGRQLFIGISMALGALYYTLRNVSLDELVTSFKGADSIYFLPALVITLLTYVIRAYRWQVLLCPFKQIPVKNIYAPLMIGSMGNILPARAGEFLRAYLISSKQGITFSGAISTIIVERLFDLICLLGLFVWVFVINVDMFDSSLTFSGISVQSMLASFGKFCSIVVGGLILFMFLLTFKEEKVRAFVSWAIRPLPENWNKRFLFMVEEFAQGCKIIRDPSALMQILLWSLGLWMLFILSYYPFYFAFDLQNKSLGSLILLSVMVCVLITILPTPGFLGSFNAGVLIALHNIMGEKEVTAVSFGMASWATGFFVLIVGGLFFIFKDHLSLTSLMEAKENSAK